MELFGATGGEHWSSHDGWGTTAPVCEWSGVACFPQLDAPERMVVVALRLGSNHLEGILPPTLGDLKYLSALDVSGNRLTGLVPERLLARWAAHRLELDVDGNAFANLVVRVIVTHQAAGVLCAETEDVRYRIELDAVTQRARSQSVRCTAGSRQTYCLRREGRPASLARVSGALGAIGFFTLKGDYDYRFTSRTHGLILTTTAVWGDGTLRSLDTYDRQGPQAAWLAQQIFLGLVAETAWETQTRTPTCDFK